MKNNIIKMKPNSTWEFSDTPGEISTITRKVVFANVMLVDILKESVANVDILVVNGIVEDISPRGKLKVDGGVETLNLHEALVIPTFFDGCSFRKTVLNAHYTDDEKNKALMAEYMGMKSIMAGAVSYLPAEGDTCILVENAAELDEQRLSQISQEAATERKLVILKVGQTLDELGSVDKKFGKPLPQVLEDFGILDKDWMLVGGNCFEKDDLELFSHYGNKFAICPTEDGQLGHRPINLKTLQNLGFEVRIGTGKAFEVDFFAYMRQILMTQWQFFEDNTCISEKDILMLALDNYPTLEKGMHATFNVLKNEPNLYDNICKRLVWGMSKKDILITVCDGEILQELGGTVSQESGKDNMEIIEQIRKNWGKKK